MYCQPQALRLWLLAAHDQCLFLIVYAFEVIVGPDALRLDLAIDNPELLRFAALTGDNVTADITQSSQLVISQDGVILSFDCSSLLPDSQPGVPLPTVAWTRSSSEFLSS